MKKLKKLTKTQKQRLVKLLIAAIVVLTGIYLYRRRKAAQAQVVDPSGSGAGGGNYRKALPASIQRGIFYEIPELQLVQPAPGYSWQFSQIPGFTMPAGQTWVMWSGSAAERAAGVTKWGFTHLQATFLTIGAIAGNEFGSERAARAWFDANCPGAKLYDMIGDGYLKNDAAAKIPGLYDPANTSTTAGQVRNAFEQYLGNRARGFGLQSKFDNLSLDLEDLPSTAHNLQIFRDGIQSFKASNPDLAHVAFDFYATEPVGLYPNSSERYESMKGVVGAYQNLVPYVYLDHFRFGNNPKAGKEQTAYWLYQMLKWVEMRETWVGQKKPREVSWFQAMWANFEDAWGSEKFIRRDIMAALVPWYCVLGGARFGGGGVLWEDGKQHQINLDEFVAGMWRVGQITSPFEDANAVYNIRLEYSQNNGATWETYDPRKYYQALGAIDLDVPYQLDQPVVRGMFGNGMLVAIATKPTLTTGEENILVRYKNRTFGMPIRARKTTFGYIQI